MEQAWAVGLVLEEVALVMAQEKGEGWSWEKKPVTDLVHWNNKDVGYSHW
jgi:hypothetical protein